MVIIINVHRGEVYDFKTRKRAGEYLGITQRTLRKWLSHPFYLHESFIILSINGKRETKNTTMDSPAMVDQQVPV